MVMTLTTPRGSDLLAEISRRCQGRSLQSLVAYPTPAQDWQVMLRMRGEAPKEAPAAEPPPIPLAAPAPVPAPKAMAPPTPAELEKCA